MSLPEVVSTRWPGIDEVLRGAQVDAVVVHGVGALGRYGDLTYLTGHLPSAKGCYAVKRRGSRPVLVMADPQEAELATEDPQVGADVVVGPADHAALLGEVARAAEPGPVLLAGPVPMDDAGLLRAELDDVAATVPATAILADLRGIAAEHDALGLRTAAAAAEAALHELGSFLRAGVSERAAAAVMEAELVRRGSLLRIVHVAAGRFRGQRPGDHVLADGDVVTAFAETTGPTGHWVELGVVFHLGDVEAVQAHRSHAMVDLLSEGTAMLRTGTTAAEVAARLQARIDPLGRPTISLGHGTGVDETGWAVTATTHRRLRAGEVVALHPTVHSRDTQHAVGVANTSLVGADGGRPLSRLPFTVHRIT